MSPGSPAGEGVDVVIVGSGFAGLAAGIEALQAGARVAIVEKRHNTGGNSRISDGVVAAAGFTTQSEAGIDDSAELLEADMLSAGMGRNDASWARLVAVRSAEALGWLIDEIGCTFHPTVYHFGGHSRARCVEAIGRGKGLVNALESRYRTLGGEVITEAFVSGLDVADNGRVVGVNIVSGGDGSGELHAIRVRRGVIVAAGGFAGDVAMRSRHDDRLGADVGTTNRPGTTGEILDVLSGLGAELRGLEWIQLGPWTSPDEKGYGLAPNFTSFAAFPYGIIVDAATGERFVDELGDRRRQADAILARGLPSLAIAGAEAVELSGQRIDPALRTGSVGRYDSLAALARAHGTDHAALEQTVTTFNRAVDSGIDPAFGKPILAGSPRLTPPFFASRLWPKTHFTMGGVATDLGSRVLRPDGRPIEGLFAAGEVTGGTHGVCRLSSMAIPECIVQGRIAGRSAAQGH